MYIWVVKRWQPGLAIDGASLLTAPLVQVSPALLHHEVALQPRNVINFNFFIVLFIYSSTFMNVIVYFGLDFTDFMAICSNHFDFFSGSCFLVIFDSPILITFLSFVIN